MAREISVSVRGPCDTAGTGSDSKDGAEYPSVMKSVVPRLVAATASMSRRFYELISYVQDPDIRVPATPDWSITDVAGHVATEPGRYLALSRGEGSWPARVVDLPTFNDRQVRDLPSRDLSELGAILLRETDKLLAHIEADESSTMMFDGDQEIRSDRALGTLLGEFLVHGHDIAAVIGRAWPIDPGHVPLVMAGLHQVLPGWVDPSETEGHSASYELRIRGYERHVYHFTDGKLTVNPPNVANIDVHISVDPVTQLLLNYGRINPVKAALTGKVIAWGRRPWLASGLTRRFLNA